MKLKQAIKLFAELDLFAQVLREWDDEWHVIMESGKNGADVFLSDSNDEYEGETMRDILKKAKAQWCDVLLTIPKKTKDEDLEVREWRDNVRSTIAEVQDKIELLEEKEVK